MELDALSFGLKMKAAGPHLPATGHIGISQTVDILINRNVVFKNIFFKNSKYIINALNGVC
jgi:hypothetical protein